MKKISLLIGLLTVCIFAAGQTSTIKDYGNYVLLEYDHGDTIPVNKEDATLDFDNGYVQILMPADVIDSRMKNHFKLVYSEFGFADYTTFKTYMVGVMNRVYTESYAYDANDIMDSAWFVIGSDTAYINVYTNDGTNITGKTVLPQ